MTITRVMKNCEKLGRHSNLASLLQETSSRCPNFFHKIPLNCFQLKPTLSIAKGHGKFFTMFCNAFVALAARGEVPNYLCEFFCVYISSLEIQENGNLLTWFLENLLIILHTCVYVAWLY
jgi:hypothetical protein